MAIFRILTAYQARQDFSHHSSPTQKLFSSFQKVPVERQLAPIAAGLLDFSLDDERRAGQCGARCVPILRIFAQIGAQQLRWTHS